MYTARGVDRFEIINGPEDGTEFALTRAPFDIGSDPGCTVSARLDEEVNSYHARAAAAGKGYRIRSLAGYPVWVNGRRAGRIKSRLARDKDIVKVGRTEFMVHLAEGGLATRSFGTPGESDWAYAMRGGGRALLGVLGLGRWLYNVRFMRLLVFLALGIGVASLIFPGFGYSVLAWLKWGFAWGMYYLQRLIASIRGAG